MIYVLYVFTVLETLSLFYYPAPCSEQKKQSKPLSDKTKGERLAKAHRVQWRRNCEKNVLVQKRKNICPCFPIHRISLEGQAETDATGYARSRTRVARNQGLNKDPSFYTFFCPLNFKSHNCITSPSSINLIFMKKGWEWRKGLFLFCLKGKFLKKTRWLEIAVFWSLLTRGAHPTPSHMWAEAAGGWKASTSSREDLWAKEMWQPVP